MVHLRWCGTSFINFIIRKEGFGGREGSRDEGRERGRKEGRVDGGREIILLFFFFFILLTESGNDIKTKFV